MNEQTEMTGDDAIGPMADSPGDRDNAYAAYSMHLTRVDIDRVYHHAHYIPCRHGITAAFFAKNYPGWSIQSMLAVFQAAGIVSYEEPCGMSGKCHWRVKALHLNGADDFEVEWNDEIHEDDGRYFWRGVEPSEEESRPDGAQLDTGGYLISLDGLDLRKRRVRKELLRTMVEKLTGKRPKRRR